MQLALSLPRPSLSRAEAFKDLLARCCGGSSPILDVVKLKYNSGHDRCTYNATVTMFDGRRARVRIVDWGTALRPKAPLQLTWVVLSGGDIELADGQWRRVKAVAA